MSGDHRPRLSTTVRLAAIGGASDRLRVALTAFGSAVAAVLLLSAVNVLLIGRSGIDRYQSALLSESGLHPGVVATLLVLTVPLVAFVGQCVRIGAPTRNRRLAMLRMGGATSRDVRRVVTAETVIAATFGAVLGSLLFIGVRAQLPTEPDQGGALPWPTDVWIPIPAFLAVVVALAAASGFAANLALGRTIIDPMGVSRRQPPRAPAVFPFLLLVGGALAMAFFTIVSKAVPSGSRTDGTLLALAFVFFVCCASGLTLGAATLSQRLGGLVRDRCNSPALLVAGSRLVSTPFRASRSLGSVLIAVLIGSIIQQLRTAFLLATDPDDTFYASTFDLLDLALGVAIVFASAGLLVGAAEGIAERRRLLASLVALGTLRLALAKSVLAETLIPLAPGVLVAAVTGTLIARGFTGESVEAYDEITGNSSDNIVNVPVPWTELAWLTGGSIVAAGLVTALSLVLLPSTTSTRELRAAA